MRKSDTYDLTLPRYLSEKETAVITGRSISSLQGDRWKNRGIPYHKERKKVTYLLSDILEYMEQHRIVPEGNYEN